ncbi:ERF family protein [Streptomyces rimosus]|uniref:ERF family protein n=1 Tax=Streptomyces rimosus TaxID=1927 RepID=UPI0004BF82DF|nr:ERF family protein [Streptomyces rimosus]
MAETETTPHLTVDEAMIAVMREIDPVGKNGTNKKMGYKFQAYDDIVAEIGPRMAKYGLRMLPQVIDQKHFTRGENVNVAILTVRYVMRGPQGDEMDTPIIVVGEGADVADKASNKAMTAAKKYAYKQVFEISDGEDDGDHEHPVSARNPLGWYLGQIEKREVWKNPNALYSLLEQAAGAGLAELHMPDRPGVTFRQVIEGQRNKLLAEQQARAERQAAERQAAQAQMAAEYPDPPDPYDDAWGQAVPQRPAAEPAVPAPAPPAPPALPDAEIIEQQMADALADPATAEPRLHALRAQYGAGTLAQVVVRSTEWGTVDANSAITMALMSKAASPQPSPAPQPDAAPAAAEPPPPAAATPRQAKRTANMTAEERAQASMIDEVEFQAQMLGMPSLEFVADLLPPGASSIDDIRGGSRLQDHIRAHRGEVLERLKAQGMTQAAEAYAKFGDRVPARKFNEFLKRTLQAR